MCVHENGVEKNRVNDGNYDRYWEYEANKRTVLHTNTGHKPKKYAF